MKKVIVILIAILFITGCGNKENFECPPEGKIEEGHCKINAEEYAANKGFTCEESHRLEEDHCILEDIKEPIKKYSCENGLTLDGDKCTGTISKKVSTTYSCSEGTLKGTKCVTKTLIGDATTNCNKYSDPKTMKDGKCYLGKPTLGDGCATGDTKIGDWCYNLNEPKDPGYSCAKGTLEGTKCYSTKEVAAEANKKCESGYTLNGDKCIKTITNENAKVEISCENGYTLNEDKCTKILDTAPAVEGYICEDPAFVLENDKCVRYEFLN